MLTPDDSNLNDAILSFLDELCFERFGKVYSLSKGGQFFTYNSFSSFQATGCSFKLCIASNSVILDEVAVTGPPDFPKILDMLRRHDYGPAITHHRLKILHALREDEA